MSDTTPHQHPEKSVLGVYLTLELQVDAVLSNQADTQWCLVAASYMDDEATEFWVNIEGPIGGFKELLRGMDMQGCSQNFISHFKYARDLGAKWVLLRSKT